MKILSKECARSDMACEDCRLEGCNCDCHKKLKDTLKWRTSLKEHSKRRYYVGKGTGKNVWYVFDHGTLANPTTRTVATCETRGDAHRMAVALNKQNR